MEKIDYIKVILISVGISLIVSSTLDYMQSKRIFRYIDAVKKMILVHLGCLKAEFKLRSKRRDDTEDHRSMDRKG